MTLSKGWLLDLDWHSFRRYIKMPNSFTKAHCDEERNGACDASSVCGKTSPPLPSFIGCPTSLTWRDCSYKSHVLSSRSHVKPTDVKFISSLGPIKYVAKKILRMKHGRISYESCHKAWLAWTFACFLKSNEFWAYPCPKNSIQKLGPLIVWLRVFWIHTIQRQRYMSLEL